MIPQRTWYPSPYIKHHNIPVRQVYVWILDKEKKVVIVSKDNLAWQLPGGKPETGEGLSDTAKREVREETGLKIGMLGHELSLFGYYVIENDMNTEVATYIQARMYIQLEHTLRKRDLTIHHEPDQPEGESIQHVRTVLLPEATRFIPWLESSGEFKTLIGHGLISIDPVK